MSETRHATSLVADHVQLGADARIGAFVIVGELAHGQDPATVRTVLGARANLRSSVDYDTAHRGTRAALVFAV